jgi:hypothetical protein
VALISYIEVVDGWSNILTKKIAPLLPIDFIKSRTRTDTIRIILYVSVCGVHCRSCNMFILGASLVFANR